MRSTESPDISEAKLALDSLSIFRSLLKDEVVGKFYSLLDYIVNNHDIKPDRFIGLYNAFYFCLISSSNLYSFKEYIIDRMLYDENIYSLKAETVDFGQIDERIKHAASHDLYCLQAAASLSHRNLKEFVTSHISLPPFQRSLIENLPVWDFKEENYCINPEAYQDIQQIKSLFLSSNDWGDCLSLLSEFYKKSGCGLFGRFKAFTWERCDGKGSIVPIDSPDPVRLSDLIGYTAERSEVINNTIQFLEGFPANNVLLYGSRGTGKSSTVKAILNEYHNRDLRVIEVPKNRLIDFTEIVKQLKGRKYKFIIFVDDLAFEDNEENYTALKAVLEGGLECRPGNVLIYATSNRRHLIKEKFSDRAGLRSDNPDDEIRAGDTIQEKLSLADRFGITVIFPSPDKSAYLEIVEGIAAKRGISMDTEQLHKEALKWELWYNGRSPRTARQFIDWLEGRSIKNN